ncbi:uncharacterized protein LOC129595674 [Paramacrobiotus metropolitanus]|uniref:uncharacterized protein LOC129595674 n=1 Tax=Paramacrobiotus metropolitanus TaxID=2943436 RepID=UPI002446147E|nr:uncharacterized protein LOC129595674 [Paramacrobiotus metropolitanus]
METKSAGIRSFSAGDLVMSCDPLVWMLKRSAYKTHCAYCLRKSPELRTCSGCQLHRYCNSACQTADWKVEHKLECAMLKDLVSTDPLGTVNALLKAGLPAGSLAANTTALPPPPPVDLFTFSAVSSDLTGKLANKIKKNTMIDIPGIGPKSVKDILLTFPTNPSQPRAERMVQFMQPNVDSKNSTTFGIPSPDIMTYCGMLMYNGVDIFDSPDTTVPIGRAVYAQAPVGRMTPVCMDINVELNRRGRRLVIHAVEDIPQYTGLRDLRYSEMEEAFCMTRAERRAEFEGRHKYPCTCRRCSEEYDADINSLKCVTVGCTNRIPSDSRALAPCAECGALNGHRLKQFRGFLQQHEAIKTSQPREQHEAMIMQLCKEMDAAGILQPDAHFRFICGWKLAEKHYNENRFADGWKMMREFVTCVRNVCPKYADMRAFLLVSAAKFTAEALENRILHGVSKLSRPAKQELDTLARQACCSIVDIGNEGKDIFALLFGEDSTEAQMSHNAMEYVISAVCRIRQHFPDNK